MSGWDLVQLYAIYCPTSAHIFGGMVERGRQKTMSRRGGAQHTFEYIYISIYVVHFGEYFCLRGVRTASVANGEWLLQIGF